MTKFSNYKATKTLQRLAEQPIDLTKPNNLTPERLAHFVASACDYKLIYGTERITEQVIEALKALATESQAVEKMLQMQAGATLNKIEGFPSENRAVLHTATRDFFDHPQSSSEAKAAAQSALQQVEKLREFCKEIDQEKKFTDLILVGIGGSDLGPRAHFIALQYLLRSNHRVHFVANIDPDDPALTLTKVSLKNTLVVVVSKTGTTLETAANEAIFREAFLRAKLDPHEHMISVTMPGSPLDDEKKYRKTFHIWDWIGGRYSTTSMVGGVVLAFAFGFDQYMEFLRGANAMDKVACERNVDNNLPLLAALLSIWNRNFLKHETLAIIPYSQALSRFPAHLQQLSMESNGKRIDRHGKVVDFQTGSIIWGEPGTSAQHSFFQLLHQGTTIVPIEFIGYGESQFQQDILLDNTTSQQKLLANLFAQMIALAQGAPSDNPNKVFSGNRPSHLILGKRLTAYALGALLAFYEHKVAFEGFIWDINSFDQEGVQLGKVLANKIIKRIASPQSTPKDPLGDVLLQQLK